MNHDNAESQDDMMGLMDEDELDPEMQDTLRARLAKKTHKSYEDTLTVFSAFCLTIWTIIKASFKRTSCSA